MTLADLPLQYATDDVIELMDHWSVGTAFHTPVDKGFDAKPTAVAVILFYRGREFTREVKSLPTDVSGLEKFQVWAAAYHKCVSRAVREGHMKINTDVERKLRNFIDTGSLTLG